MATHVQQHFVPKFLLEQWHTGQDSKLTAFRWAHSKLDAQRYKAKSVARIAHLYSLHRGDGHLDVALERDFLGPHIDDPAALVHQAILKSGLTLTNEQQLTWAKFVVSLLVRGPGMIEHLRALGREELTTSLEESPIDYEAVRGDAKESTLLEFVSARNAALFENFGVQLLPQVLSREQFLGPLLAGKTWLVRPLNNAKRDLLIGDRPVIQEGLITGEHVFTLPLSPQVLFAVCSSQQVASRLGAMAPDELVTRLNTAAVRRAETYVFASSGRQEPLVRKWLTQP